MKTVLVTGGAGFIGSCYVLSRRTAGERVVNLDKLTYSGNIDNLASLDGDAEHIFVRGDIGDALLVRQLLHHYQPDAVINFAAESHVDNSITGPKAFIETNIVGTFTLLDVARNAWMEAPHKFKAGYEGCRFHHISTDEVYGALGETGFFKETTPYDPSSPYSASKASSDMLVRAYHRTYGMNVTVSNCSNNYGPKQHPEKLIPKIISNALSEKNIPIYGDGKNVRDWLYVLDHCKAIDLIFHRGKSGETYNIGGHNERNNLQIVDAICSILDKKCPKKSGGSYKDLIVFVSDRPGHDRRYAIDATKLTTELGWKADENFDTGIVKTVDWYLEKLA